MPTRTRSTHHLASEDYMPETANYTQYTSCIQNGTRGAELLSAGHGKPRHCGVRWITSALGLAVQRQRRGDREKTDNMSSVNCVYREQ